ncbi:MAG: betaine/proline/choline family ABC transporter ATP-binding protein [Bacillota bacterium]|nr:betaine/proline/choline family ABC transporter ATP-binding protein [Bacillota bacterium]
MIQLENVTKKFSNGLTAVDEVSLNINEGEFVVFIGPSGCGKTTTMKMINRLIEPTQGKIMVNGIDISKQDPIQLRRGIGYVIQEIGLMPHMTVAENIALIPKLQKWPKDKQQRRVEELLDMVGLKVDETINKYPRQLSGGQRQRVGVARALAVDPPVMLMDEPFGALDPITREQLQDEFIRLQQKVKKTIVFVTHDMDEAIKFADRLVILDKGKIVQCDSPQNILRNPANSFVRDFVGTDHALRQLSLIKIEDVMITNINKLKPYDSIGEAKRLFVKGYRSIVIVDDNEKVLGYINKDDAEKQQDQQKISEIMISNVETIKHDKCLKEALNHMLRYDFGSLIVVDGSSRLLGIITPNCLYKNVGEGYVEEENRGA